jgi:hypothetical protein
MHIPLPPVHGSLPSKAIFSSISEIEQLHKQQRASFALKSQQSPFSIIVERMSSQFWCASQISPRAISAIVLACIFLLVIFTQSGSEFKIPTSFRSSEVFPRTRD